jgi:hypothetical protein
MQGSGCVEFGASAIFWYFFQTGFTPPCAGPRQRDLRHSYGGQVRFTMTPFMTGFPFRSNTQIYMDCQDVFLVFLFGQGLCWKLALMATQNTPPVAT